MLNERQTYSRKNKRKRGIRGIAKVRLSWIYGRGKRLVKSKFSFARPTMWNRKNNTTP